VGGGGRGLFGRHPTGSSRATASDGLDHYGNERERTSNAQSCHATATSDFNRRAVPQRPHKISSSLSNSKCSTSPSTSSARVYIIHVHRKSSPEGRPDDTHKDDTVSFDETPCNITDRCRCCSSMTWLVGPTSARVPTIEICIHPSGWLESTAGWGAPTWGTCRGGLGQC
jgi:hypothetical protein